MQKLGVLVVLGKKEQATKTKTGTRNKLCGKRASFVYTYVAHCIIFWVDNFVGASVSGLSCCCAISWVVWEVVLAY
jgi:hypothetical protein